jgi:hypothetical protein
MTKAQSKKTVIKSLIRERTKWARIVAKKRGWCAQVVVGQDGPVLVYDLRTGRRI